MKKLISSSSFVISVLFVSVLFAPLALAGQGDTAKSHGIDKDKLDLIDNIVQDAVDTENIPHGAVLVAHKGKVVYEENFGYADVASQAPLRDDTIFRIASMTKAVTSAAAMICFEEGKFEMHDPISKYIPAFANSQVAVLSADGNSFTTRDASRPITVHDVMTHRAGMIYAAFFAGPLSDLYVQEGVAEIFPYRRDETLESYINRYAGLPMLADPGTEITYGVATDVLGRLIEVWSGQTLADFFEDRIFGPMGMEDTSFFLPDNSDKIERLTTMYEAVNPVDTSSGFVERTTPEINSTWAGPRKLYCGAAGLLSTPRDYLKFAQMILDNGKYKNKEILSRKSVEMMSSNQLGDVILPDFLRVLGDQTGFGLGIRNRQSLWAGLESEGTLTFAGIYWTRYWIDPQEDLVILAFTQDYTLDWSGWTHKVKNVVYSALDK